MVGGEVAIVDSAETTARCVAAAAPPSTLNGEPQYTFLVTDAEERFRRIASEFLEREVERLELVELDRRS